MERSRILPVRVFGLKRPSTDAAKITGKHIKTNNDEVEEINAKLRKECEELNLKDKQAEMFAASVFAGE